MTVHYHVGQSRPGIMASPREHAIQRFDEARALWKTTCENAIDKYRRECNTNSPGYSGIRLVSEVSILCERLRQSHNDLFESEHGLSFTVNGTIYWMVRCPGSEECPLGFPGQLTDAQMEHPYAYSASGVDWCEPAPPGYSRPAWMGL